MTHWLGGFDGYDRPSHVTQMREQAMRVRFDWETRRNAIWPFIAAVVARQRN